MTKKAFVPNIITPEGIAKYAHLNEPQTKFKAAGTYSVHLVLDPEKDGIFLAELEGLAQAAFAKAKAENPKAVNKTVLTKPDTAKDSDGNEIPNGKVVVKFAKDAGGTTKAGKVWEFKPTLYDSQGNSLPKGTVIYGGSRIHVAFRPQPTLMPTGDFYYSLKLEAVQVVHLVSSFTRDMASVGFAKREGYIAETQNAFGEEVPAEAEVEGTGVADF